MLFGFIPLLLFCSAATKLPMKCGHKEIRKQPYGKVEVRVECNYLEDATDNNISVFELKGDVQHGISIHFDSLWRKKDSAFFVDGKENGLCLFWDTLGNIVGRKTYRNGMYVGKRESFFGPGRPALIKNYNVQGEEEGPWKEWWRNGQKKAEYTARNGRIVSGKEYYQSGKPRAFYETKYEPKNMNVLKKKFIHAEAWAPNGKSTGKIVAGQGEWILFPDGRDTANHAVFREVYKDSVMVEGKRLDSTAISKWLAP